MPRHIRVEFPGALYHVINRGNYRQDLFTVHRTGEAFEDVLFEASERFGWRVHAYVLMSNHYHIALETPRGNLTTGMQWLQSVFANRFNRFVGEIGHVFQGRYKALVVEPGYSWLRVVDYIHLNPVRAGLVSLARLRDHRLGSFPKWFWNATRRPACLTDQVWRRIGGYGLGERELRRYWAELAAKREGQPGETDRLRRELCRGWVVGAREFTQALLDQLEDKDGAQEEAMRVQSVERESDELWEARVVGLLNENGRGEEDLRSSKKSAPWKLALAARLKGETGASNRWIAERLNLGHPASASKNISHWKKQNSKV